MMNHHAFLIKEAVTTGALAGIAKQHGIPLIGDWRYATKLLHKAQKATPVGRSHYKNVLKFLSSGERQSLERQLSHLSDATKYQEAVRRQGFIPPDVAKAVSERGLPLAEVGLLKHPEQRSKSLVGIPGSMVATPVGHQPSLKEFERTVHTHPIPKNYMAQRDALRASEWGRVLPSGIVGENLPAALSQLRQQGVKPVGDLRRFNTNIPSTHVIVSPTTGMEAVYKSRGGNINRAFFRKAIPLKGVHEPKLKPKEIEALLQNVWSKLSLNRMWKAPRPYRGLD